MNSVGRPHRYGIGRWLLAIAGITCTVLSFVRLVEVNNRAAEASPWWYLGLSGVVLLALALGSPRSEETAHVDARDAGSPTPGRPPRAPT